ncbi:MULTISPECIES: rubredoxin [Prochlorococcus]|uniref:Rubredoxin n=1 Tax=Prochlorococcus marinus (strain SARG / CCMP1375 / SS120) TaxID=167539 RepID=Q7VDJ7_PROMA|nr:MULTISPECIES: rubredoxin [Prochlorococcus]AAP99425.1 Rubredoxin [Prochlorococcus marinus subsp. marinus str. CCMP1375]KGG11308.1 Rubredoxin [Prochlorococcus marinus str. LG]KGG18737.1 Rubredoxin [Prochlorococcus marinus str. SS2]KGG23011.1 Rubredoxin [Prochlorococcus marinus str. SS35]KGG33718.1 Rubredoxin [Prochlorococcus marinus str. SS51]
MTSTFTQKKHQCKDCIYSYDPKLGDPSQGVPPGVPFDDLPASWVCPLCKASKKRFKVLRY